MFGLPTLFIMILVPVVYCAGLAIAIALGVLLGGFLTAYFEPYLDRVRSAGRSRYDRRLAPANPGPR